MAHLSHHWRSSLREYVVPTLLALGLIICLPLLGILAMMVRSAVVVVIAAVVAVCGIVGLWRVSAPAVRQ